MAGAGERPDIERKITVIAERIVRARRAIRNVAVVITVWQRRMTILSSSLAGIGLAHPFLSVLAGNGPEKDIAIVWGYFSGLPAYLTVAGTLLYVMLVILKRFARLRDIRRSALRSLALHDAFRQVEARLEGILELCEPTDQMDVLHEHAITLAVSYADVMPSLDTVEGDIAAYVEILIARKSGYWNPEPPENRLGVDLTAGWGRRAVREPRVMAEFLFDSRECPECDGNGPPNQYRVRIFLEDPDPDIERVIYRLDPRADDPLHESADRAKKFEIIASVPGDSAIVVDVQVGCNTIRRRVRLSEVLRQRYSDREGGALRMR